MAGKCPDCKPRDPNCLACRRAEADRARLRYYSKSPAERHARYVAGRVENNTCNACGVAVGKWVQKCDDCSPKCLRCKCRIKSSPSYRRKFCSLACSGGDIPRSSSDRRAKRHLRDAVTPGLFPYERKRLLAKWKRQGRTCAYCPAAPTTVDHVVPLIRGGTNFEGNLAPACRPCNSSKGARLLVDWRRMERLAA